MLMKWGKFYLNILYQLRSDLTENTNRTWSLFIPYLFCFHVSRLHNHSVSSRNLFGGFEVRLWGTLFKLECILINNFEHMYFVFSCFYLRIRCNFRKQFSQKYRNYASPAIYNINWNNWANSLWYDDRPVNVHVRLHLCCGLSSAGGKKLCALRSRLRGKIRNCKRRSQNWKQRLNSSEGSGRCWKVSFPSPEHGSFCNFTDVNLMFTFYECSLPL